MARKIDDESGASQNKSHATAANTQGSTQNRSPAPSAPPLESMNAVDLAEVQFVVALNETTNSQPITAQTTSINASENLRRIINERKNCDSTGHFIISDLTENEFRDLFEYLENKKLEFRDQNHRLQMYNVARNYKCVDMQIYCLREIDAHLDVSNVITVYRTLWFYSPLTNKEPMDRKAKTNMKKANHTPEEYLDFLVFNVFQFINMNAETVLLSEEIDDLNYNELENIVKQEDLLLRSEIVLINALARWSRAECRRRNIELTSENERRVLANLCHAPRFVFSFSFLFNFSPIQFPFHSLHFHSNRYLTLKPSEFELACKNIRFLDPTELTMIRDAFDGKKSQLNADQTNMVNNFRKSRPKYTRMPFYLSPRSHPKKYSRRMRRNDRTESDGSSCLLHCLSVFICLCD